MNAENREKSKSHRFILNLSQRLEKGSSDKHVAFITRGKIKKTV